MVHRSLLVALLLLGAISYTAAQACVPVSDPAVAALRASLPMCDAQFNTLTAQNNLVLLPTVPPSLNYTVQLVGVNSLLRPMGHGPAVSTVSKAQYIPLLLPNCAATETTDPRIAGQPSFPDDTQPNPVQVWTLQLPVNGTLITQHIPAICQYYPNAFDQTAASFPCYAPWTATPADSTEGYCDQTCPSATFPEKVYKREALVSMILGWLGYVLTFVAFVTMIMMPRYRAYPAMLVPLLLVGSHIISFGFIFAAIGGYRWVICKNSYTPSDSTNGKCVFNGLTLLFGALVTTYTWCLIAINSALVFVFKKEELLTSKATRWVSIAVVMSLAVLSCVVALATKSISYQRGLLFCFLHDEVDSESFYKPFTWQYPLFIAPLGICILVSTVCMVLVFWRLLTLRIGGEKSVTMEKFVRVGLFMLIFLALYSFIFAFRFVNTVHANDWVAAFKAWSAAAVNMKDAPYVGSSPSSALCYAFAWAIACQGLLITLLFGSTSDVLFFWCSLRKRGDDEEEGNAYGLMSDTTS